MSMFLFLFFLIGGGRGKCHYMIVYHLILIFMVLSASKNWRSWPCWSLWISWWIYRVRTLF